LGIGVAVAITNGFLVDVVERNRFKASVVGRGVLWLLLLVLADFVDFGLVRDLGLFDC